MPVPSGAVASRIRALHGGMDDRGTLPSPAL